MAHDANSPYNAATHEGQSADDAIAHTAVIAAAVAQSAAAMQAALIAIATANSSAPTDGQAIIFQASTGNLVWGAGGGATYTASADFSDARNSMYLALFEDI